MILFLPSAHQECLKSQCSSNSPQSHNPFPVTLNTSVFRRMSSFPISPCLLVALWMAQNSDSLGIFISALLLTPPQANLTVLVKARISAHKTPGDTETIQVISFCPPFFYFDFHSGGVCWGGWCAVMDQHSRLIMNSRKLARKTGL